MSSRLITWFCTMAMVAASALISVSATPSVLAVDVKADQFANVNLPGDLGQTPLQVYFPETEHTLRGYFLDYWRANGGQSVYGLPISEPFASANGLYSQAFENGIFQFVLEMVWTDLPSVTLMPIGQHLLDDRAGSFREDGRRGGGGGDRRTGVWRGVDPAGVTATAAISAGGTWSESTGHTISGAFYDWYVAYEGPYYLGEPISQPVRERGLTIQYFQGAILMDHPETGVRLAPLGREMADHLGIDRTPASGSGLPLFDESLFYTAANPNPLGDITAPGKRVIYIDISEQLLTAYQGDTMITQTLVSTGLSPNDTERGQFHVRYKLKSQDMAGTVDSSGAVVAMGEEAANSAGTGEYAGQEAYVVEDVPNVMYFNYDAEALHGAYWHNNFGNPMSHGCVNLPLQMAEFLFGWAPLGTEVIVTD